MENFSNFNLSVIDFLRRANQLLNNSKSFGQDFVELKIYFCRKYQNNLIFSTRFGSDFFTETLFRLENKKLIHSEPGEKLGIYDVNFNNWILSNQ